MVVSLLIIPPKQIRTENDVFEKKHRKKVMTTWTQTERWRDGDKVEEGSKKMEKWLLSKLDKIEKKG